MRFGIELRGRRRAAALSQQDLADLIHYDRSLISLVENGRVPPSDAFAMYCDQALRAGGALIDLASGEQTGRGSAPSLRMGHPAWDRDDTAALAAMLCGDAVLMDRETARRVAHEWLVSDPPQVVELRSGRRIGAELVATVQRRTARLRRLDDHLGGGDLLDTVAGELAATVSLAREASYTEAVGRTLLAAIADLAQVAGWVASDAGAHDVAARFYLGGVHAAHAGGDPALAANLLSLLAYQTASVGDPRDAVLLARSAHRGARHRATAGARVLVAERVAWAHARAGQHARCDRVLGEVDELFEGVRPDDEPDWAYWLTRDEIDIMAGRCYAELERPIRAVPLLESALGRYQNDSAREASLYATWLADSYITAREIEQAAEVASRALDLSTTVSSTRSRDRVAAVRTRLRPYRNAPAVRSFEERYRAMAGAANGERTRP